ncbi:MAG: tRNA (adenosine(37)-N6)-threonylcarbamoyltransferase complex dimerization subunit type 1 TsaB [Candidatus Saccharimonadales bacterium]|jgi:tRNA threonylcarbamoyladenosine biosynthesis protein TsaB
MLILTIRTSEPTAEIGLFTDNNEQLGYECWEAHRQLADSIHLKIKRLLAQQHQQLSAIGGIVCFQGPGSFTGLRIGLSVGNGLSYSLQIPIVGTKGKNWITKGIKILHKKPDHRPIMPEYGAPVHITPPRK